MRTMRRIVMVSVVSGLVLAAGGLLLSELAVGQVQVQPPIIIRPPRLPQPPAPPTVGNGDNAAQLSGIKLVEKSEYRQFINVARDCIKDKAWNDAVTALQTILDTKEDYYIQVKRRDSAGHDKVRWTSVKFEANNLLGTMPANGLDVYEVRLGGKARQLLDEAKRKGDREQLADVAQRYLHTRAGLEANELLASYFLDRGQFFTAALRFEKMLQMNPERAKLSDLTLVKAALAFRRAGSEYDKDFQSLWKRLETTLANKGGLKVGDDFITLGQLQQFLQETPQPERINPHEWRFVRGDLAHSGQGSGSPPLLNLALWKPLSTTIVMTNEDKEHGKEAKGWIDRALEKQSSITTNPIMSGFFPLVANGKLLFRSHSDLRAVYLKDTLDQEGKPAKPGALAWATTTLDVSLANILADHKKRSASEEWLKMYFNQLNFSHFVYENSLIGTLSSDHRFVYLIDDLAVPAPPTIFNQYSWPNGQGVSGFQDIRPGIMQNSLHAYDLQNGKIVWRLGIFEWPQMHAPPGDDGFKDSHFLGAPLPVGGRLYVLNEKNTGPMGESELRLVCIDPNKLAGPGRPTIIEPIQTLAMVQPNNRITHDISRRINAVHLAYGEGILVCPTNAGEVLGIDLMTRTLVWSYPYRDQAPTSQGGDINIIGRIPRPGMAFTGNITAHWKSAPPAIVDGKVVFTAPDAQSIHCINLRDGEQVWKKPQQTGDLFFAGVINGKVLIVGKSKVRALNLADGADAWNGRTVELGELLPSGQGVAIKNLYYLPLAKKEKGEVLAIDVDKGTIKARNRTSIGEAKAPGNLVFSEGAVLSVTPTEVLAYQQLTTRLAQANEAVIAEPNNPERFVDRGELRLADGQVQAAVDDLHKAMSLKPPENLTQRVKQRLYEALSDLFQSDFNGASVKYLDEYREMCKVPDVKEQETRLAKFYRVVGKGREEQGHLVEAFQMYRDFSTLPINQEGVTNLDDPGHKIPTHVWFRGRISAMMARATPEQREPLEKQIAVEWQQVKAKNDVASLRQFVGLFDVPFAVGREARLQLADQIMERKERGAFLEAELNLQQLRAGDWRNDVAVGGKALAALALLEEKKGSAESMKQAAAYYREMARDFPKAALRDDKTGEDLFNELATDKRFLPYLEESSSFWSQAKFGARLLQAGAYPAGLQGFVFQPEGDMSPLVRNYRLVLDTANTANPTLRLVDLSTNNVRWSHNLGGGGNNFQMNFQYFQYLYQQGQTNTSYFPNARFRFFQVKGHLAVLQVATTVYCIDLDNPRLLWQHSLLEGNLMQPNMVLQQVMPDQEGNLVMVMWNQFNGQRVQQRIGQVGAVQASYVALVSQKGLEVLDPLRGTPMWTKANVSSRTHIFGDDRHLFLVDANENGTVGGGRALRASDGEPEEVADFSGLYRSRIRLLGHQLLAWENTNAGFGLRLYDIMTGKNAWTQTFDQGTVAVQTDDPTLTGVLQPNGRLMVLGVATGKEILATQVLQGKVKIEDLKNLKEPLLLRDRDHFYLALNQPVDTNRIQGGVIANNFSNGLRCSLVNGWFMAFHAKEGAYPNGDKFKKGDLHWHSAVPLTNQLVVLEQFQDLPILLFTARYNELINGGAGGNRWVSTTQSIHRQTGKFIHDPPVSGSSMAAQYYAFTVDLKAGTINMLGNVGALQHYIDDGRKLTGDVRGVSVPTDQSSVGAATPLPPGAPPPPGRPIIRILPAFPRR